MLRDKHYYTMLRRDAWTDTEKDRITTNIRPGTEGCTWPKFKGLFILSGRYDKETVAAVLGDDAFTLELVQSEGWPYGP